MLRKRTFGKKYNYVIAYYNGSGNIKLLGDAFDISNVRDIIYNKKSIGVVRNYDFLDAGPHTVYIYMSLKTTNCTSMFNTCTALTNVDFTHFDMKEVTALSSMFYRDTGLINLEFKGLNWSNVTEMNSFCSECSELTNISFLNIKSGKIKNLAWAFNWTSLRSCDMSGLNLGKVTTMKSMFENCWSLTSLKIMSNINSLTDTNRMFYLVWTSGTFYCSKKYDYSKLKIPFRWKTVKV